MDADPSRRHEDTLRAAHLERSLHGAVPRPGMAAGADARRAVKDLSRLPAATRKGVLSAASRARKGLDRDSVTALASSEGFARLGPRVQRALCELLAQARGDGALSRALGLLVEPLAGLKEDVQLAAAKELSRHASDEPAQALLHELIAHAAFAELEAVEQIELLRYAGGPRPGAHGKAERRRALARAWEPRREALRRAIEGAGAEELRDLLHTPSETVHLLQATGGALHHLVVFGDPADPASGSYGQRWRALSADAYEVSVESPDRAVRSGWRDRELEPQPLYFSQALSITRFEALLLCQWLEDGFGVASAATARLGAAPVLRTSDSIARACLATLEILAAPRGGAALEEGHLSHGRPIGEPPRGAEDDLLLRYLAA